MNTPKELVKAEKGAEALKAPQRVNDLMEAFLASQDVKRSSRALYKRTLRQFFKWVDKTRFPLCSIARAEIIRYKEDLLDSGLSELTVGSYLTVVRKFYEWAEANKYYPNVAKGVKAPRRYKGFKKDPLAVEQIKELLSSIDATDLRGKRDYAILNLMVRTGLRTIEVVRADVGDMDYKGGELILYIQGKGSDSKTEFVLLTPKASKPIYAYLTARGKAEPGEPLFTSLSNKNHEGRLTTRSISRIAKQTLRGTGIDSNRLTAHSLRHSAGVNVLRAGGDLL